MIELLVIRVIVHSEPAIVTFTNDLSFLFKQIKYYTIFINSERFCYGKFDPVIVSSVPPPVPPRNGVALLILGVIAYE